MCATPKAGQKLPPLTTYIIVGHLRKLFKFQIYSWAPGWIELALGYTSFYILHMVLSGALAPPKTFTILLTQYFTG